MLDTIRRAKASVIVACIVAIVSAHAAYAADKTMDIGRNVAGSSLNEPVPAGDVSIKITGTVNAAYRFDVQKETIPIADLVKPGTVTTPFAASPQPASAACQPVKAAVESALKAWKDDGDEAKFFTARREAEALFATTTCAANELSVFRQQFDSLVATTVVNLGPYALESGQKLRLTVTRLLADGKDGSKWSYEFTTGSRGGWRASWGLGIIPDRDDDYFSKEIGPSQFQVTEKRRNNGVNPAAAVFYSWLSEADRQKSVTNGPTVGLGLDQNNLMVFLGWNWTYHEVVGLSIGTVVHQQTRLKGEFTKDQVLSQSLTEDALEEKVYRPNAFIGITMRFAK